MIHRKIVFLAVAVLSCGLSTPLAYAQRGMGGSSGVARQGILPELASLSGKLVAIETHTCEKTTGHGVVGTHLKLETDEGEALNIDLGWATAVEPIVKRLVVGQQVTVVAFRTDKMPEGQYVAKTVTFGGKTMQLRDDNLRPTWAGSRSVRNGSKKRFGYGTGRGLGRGRGWKGGRGAQWSWRFP